MATLKDVAKMANVDVSTVSRALNGSGYVHPDTKKRVLEAVKLLRYRPNMLAKSLKQGKKNAIGVVVPNLSVTIFADIIQSVTATAEKRGYSTIIVVTRNDGDIEHDALRRLQAGFVDGILIASTGKNQDLLREIDAGGIPVVQIIRRVDEALSSVVANYYQTGYDAVSFLYSKGCRHIGLVNGPLSVAPYRERYTGYRDAINSLGIGEIVYLSGEGDRFDYFELGWQGTASLIADNPELDAIIVATELAGMGAIRALKQANKRIPSEVSLLSLTGSMIGSRLETTMTALDLPAAKMGSTAVEILDRQITDKDRTKYVEKIIFDSTLSVRETTR